MTNKTRIEIGSIEDLKKLLTNAVGPNPDCAVVEDKQVPSDDFKLSTVSTEEFLNIARNHLSDGNFAVVKAEYMNKPLEPKSSPKKPKM